MRRTSVKPTPASVGVARINPALLLADTAAAICAAMSSGRVESLDPRTTTPPAIGRWLLDIGFVRQSPPSAIAP